MVQLGFNLMGHPNVNKDGVYNNSSLIKQVDVIDKFFDDLKKQDVDVSNIWLRLRGGNGSQRFSDDIFNKELISLWVGLQKKHKFKLIYTINYNDYDDAMFYMNLVINGLIFHAIEFGNEQYLPKFRKTPELDETGCVTKRTEKMTPEKYVKLTNDYFTKFIGVKLPWLVQFAPQGKTASTYYKSWNDAVYKLIKDNKSLDLNASLHCYGNDFPYSLIKDIKKKSGKNVFVTEYGADDELAHVNQLLKVLGDNDCMMSHELYNDYKGDSSKIAWFNVSIITFKGGALLDKLFLNTK